MPTVCEYTTGNNSPLTIALLKAQKEEGFVGMDLRMAALAILHKRGEAPGFKLAAHTAANIDYWARKREFGHARCASEDEVIKLAEEQYLNTAHN